MPSRRGRAFSDLERMAKKAGLQAAAGSPLGNYLAYKAGTRKKEMRKTTGKPTAAERKRMGIAVIPFNKPVVTGPLGYYSTTITVWSANGRTAMGLSDLELGYAAPTGVSDSSDFFPAIIKPVRRLSTTPTNAGAISGITGEKYDYYATNSYSVPFGRRAANPTDTEETRRADLSDAAKSATPPAHTVGYEPEVWRHDPRSTAAPLAGTTAPAGA
jgi:hypothetical protein